LFDHGIEVAYERLKPSVIARQLLLVEDDCEVAHHLSENLTQYSFIVTHAASGVEALALAHSNPYDIMIIDRMMPGMGGLTLIANLRKAELFTPVLVLSGLGEVDDRVSGLKAGGDDYLIKPYAFVEVVARLEALLRRPTIAQITTLTVGSLRLDLMARRATRNGRDLNLLPREFRLLEYMARSPGCILTRGMLLRDVWNYRSDTETNLVDVHICKLRRKLDPPGEMPLILSVRGAGFMFKAPE
jgi:two-component system, OmpR family, response regulator